MANKSGTTANGTDNETGSNRDETGGVDGKLEQIGSGDERDVDEGTGISESGNSQDTPKPQKFASETTGKKKRGRPPKAKSTGTAEAGSTDTKAKTASKLVKEPLSQKTVESFAAFYQFANNTLATAYKAPDFQISGPEAVAVAEPLAEILNDMGLLGANLDTPYIKLAMAVMGVYGGRVMARVAMAKQRAAAMREAETVEPASAFDAEMARGATKMNFDEPRMN